MDAAVVLVAHDRWFLESVTTAVLELEGGRSLCFAAPGTSGGSSARLARGSGESVARVGTDIDGLSALWLASSTRSRRQKQAQAELTQIGRLEKERKTAADELENLTRRRRTMGFDFLKPARPAGSCSRWTGCRSPPAASSCSTAARS